MKDANVNREGDIVLVYFKDQPTTYARIEFIEPDIKKDWYQVTFQLLTIPSQVVTWILREEYINGESFTMGGNPMKFEKIKPYLWAEKNGIPKRLFTRLCGGKG